MVVLYIDDKQAQLDVSVRVAFPVEAPGDWDKPGRKVELSLPLTVVNAEAMGDVGEVFSQARFNNTLHRGRLEEDGCTVFFGTVCLQGVEKQPGGGGWYHIVITQERAGWVEKAQEAGLKETTVEFETTISPQTIRQSWTWEKPVRFLPVQRDDKLVQNVSGTVIPPARILSSEDYHPFIHVKTVVRSIIEGAGYKLVSSFMDSPLFESLYMSGYYPEQNTEIIKKQVNFRAGRSADVSGYGDSYGILRANPNVTTYSIGNIVETADPTALSGQVIAGVFNTNNAFRKIGNRVCFVPLKEIQVGFEYNLRYKTPYKILSRTELSGFNTVALDDQTVHTFVIPNNFVDNRENPVTGKSYLFMVFEFVQGTSYQVRFKWRGVEYTAATFTTQTGTFSFPAGWAVDEVSLWTKTGSAAYVKSTKDYALYDGYVAVTGTTEVEVCLRSAPQKVTPSAPKYFDTVYFAGAWVNAQLTLYKESYIRPIFSATPALGSKVTFRDVAAHPVKQIELLDSLRHLFNLRFDTDNYLKQVVVEPYEAIADNDVMDWTGKIDPGKPVLIGEPGEGISRVTVYCYKKGDDAVRIYDAQNGTTVGQWRAEIENGLARDKEASAANPMFTPTLSVAGGYPDAKSALFMQVGERDADALERNDTMNFPPKIVRYLGMEKLPSGQVWGWPWPGDSYPLAAFHYPSAGERGFTLGFEDREGMPGLRRFYKSRYAALGGGRRITAWMRLSGEDVEKLLIPEPGGGFGSRVRIRIDSEEVICSLESIPEYRPGSGESVKCVFQSVG